MVGEERRRCMRKSRRISKGRKCWERSNRRRKCTRRTKGRRRTARKH